MRQALLSFLVALFSAGPVASPAPQGGAQVSETGTSVTARFQNGHQVQWGKSNCGLAQWQDGRGVFLSPGMGLAFNGQGGGRTYQSYALDGDGVRFACTVQGAPLSIRVGPADRTFGVPYHGLAIQVGVQTLPMDTIDVSLTLAPNHQPNDFKQLHVEPIWEGLIQFNLDAQAQYGGDDRGSTTFTLLHHPQGTVLAYLPDFGPEKTSATGWNVQPPSWTGGAGVLISKTFAAPVRNQAGYTAPPFLVLFADQAAGQAAAQNWLDARLGTLWEQWHNLGLGPQHLSPRYEGGLPGQHLWPLDDPNRFDKMIREGKGDAGVQFAHTGMFRNDDVNGPPSTINHTDALDTPDLFLPNASDLPASIPGVTFPGQPPLQDPKEFGYTQGTMTQLRDYLSAERALGMIPGIWSRDYYPGCFFPDANNATQWSRWDKGWTCSYLWKAHPEWEAERADGTLDPNPVGYPNIANPAVLDWIINWHTYWIDQGLLSFFKDTGCAPCGGRAWYNRQHVEISQNSWAWWTTMLHRGTRWIMGEQPIVFAQWTGEKSGNPAWQKYQEWIYPFSMHNWGFIARGEVIYPQPGMAWDTRAAERTHSILGAHGCCPDDGSIPVDDTYASGIKHYTHLAQAYGPPDRVQLVNVRQVTPANSLEFGMSATDTILMIHNRFALPVSTVITVGGEQMYVANRTDTAQMCATYPPLGQNYGCSGIRVVRGYNGTTATAHAAGTSVTSADDIQHWDWDDSYWVYGVGTPQEQWVRYSDAAVFGPGGAGPASLPQISNVQVNGSTVTWQTDRPTTGWVEYDTFGGAESYSAKRNAEYWPAYHWRTADALGAQTPTTTHSATLEHVVAGQLYHYRVVARRPNPATTLDATFTAGQNGPTPTPVGATATRTPTPPGPTATPGGATATPVPSLYDLRVSTQPSRAGAVPLGGATVSGNAYIFSVPEDAGTIGSVRFYLDDPTQSGDPIHTEGNPPYDFAGTNGAEAFPWDTTTLTDGAHTITAVNDLRDGGVQVAAATFTVQNTASIPTATPTRTATPVPPTATRTPTLPATATPTVTPARCRETLLLDGTPTVYNRPLTACAHQ